MMKTPICDFVKSYAASGALRLHMPGHKGIGMLGCEMLDITEIDGADVLYSASGIIKESEANAASLFGSALTKYSAEGSSLSIRAMLYLAVLTAKNEGKRPLIAAGRNAHKVFMTAAALLEFDIKWLYGDDGGMISCNLTPETVEAAFASDEKPTAVYVTSPDYLGNVADIKTIAVICRKNGALLLVDNAHGAYLNFLPENRHPLALGADICCDSAHKTLPVLTGGGYLHIGKTAPRICFEMAESAMALFASTSPSYLILQSLDMANVYLAGNYRERLRVTAGSLGELKSALAVKGWCLAGDEPVKLTIMPKSCGYLGCELADVLSKNGMICEFSDPDYTVMMFTPESGDGAVRRLGDVLLALPKRAPITAEAPKPTLCPVALSVREAIMSPSEVVPVSEALGRVLAETNVACPPAIPIAVCGEVIDGAAIEAFKYYGVTHCRVVK